MTDTRQAVTARQRAIDQIDAIRNAWWPTPVPAGELIDGLTTDTLLELHDERLMAAGEWT